MMPACRVALLAEGVDRNPWRCTTTTKSEVALLAEGVDRNATCVSVTLVSTGSPSSRRAWIEIHLADVEQVRRGVALLAEGVDRNQQVAQADA